MDELEISTNLPIVPADESPDSVRARIPALKARLDQDYMRLARDLWLVFTCEHYSCWGFATFEDYVVKEVQIPFDRANRLRRLYSKLVLTTNIRPVDLKGVTYTAANLISTVVDRNNAKEWVADAKQLTYKQLKKKVEESRPRFSTSELETNTTLNTSTLVERPKEEKYRKISFVLTEEQAKVVDEAMAVAERVTKSPHDGYKLSCIALQFLSHNLTGAGPKLPFLMTNLERIFGGTLIHVKRTSGLKRLQQFVADNPDLFATSEDEDSTGETISGSNTDSGRGNSLPPPPISPSNNQCFYSTGDHVSGRVSSL